MTIDYRDTIFLPKTDFPMKGNLPNREPKWLERWNDIDIYAKIRESAKGREKYVLHDGPPYANGDIHMGHAMNKILKDIIVRTQQMLGKDAPYVPGWDCHGLPIEWMIEKKYKNAGKNKDEVDPIEFRKECRVFAEKWVGIQRDEFKRLGIFGDWDDPYLTMDFASEAQIVRELLKFLMNGGLYRGSKSIMWSVVEKTALAEAEVEYMDHTSHMIDVGFNVVKSNVDAIIGAKVVIWTTTPWTMPGNRGIAYGKDFDYVLVEVSEVEDTSRVKVGEKVVLAKALVEAFSQRAGITAHSELASFKGSDIEGTICHHPWNGQGFDYDVPVVEGFHVTTDAGTGFVHIAPSHGQEDFEVGQQFDLETPFTVDESGLYYDNIPMFAGEHVYKVHDHICEEMEKVGALLARDTIVHSYPHSWRSKAPLIYRNTPQWFISMEKNDLREKALKAIDSVRWIPENSQNRIEAMVSDRPDWLISRQRAWGVPITVFVHKATNELLKDEEVNERIATAVEETGADAWYATDAQEILGNKYNADDYEQVTDILDVWFDSGVTHYFVVDRRDDIPASADLYLEGSDQHRGWFMSSLMSSTAMHGHAPYKEVLTHGFTVDAHGRKMSKSVGNVVAPQEVTNKLGADILRLWVASTDYRGEIAVSDEILKRAADSYRRVRNTARFLLANLNGFTVEDAVAEDEMVALDRWIVARAKSLQDELIEAYEKYDLLVVMQKLMHFCSIELGSFYLDVIKDRQYTAKADGVARRSCQTAMYHIVEALVRWMAPITSFTAQEIWETLPGERSEFVFTETWYEGFNDFTQSDTFNDALWHQVLSVKDAANQAMEQARKDGALGGSLEASIELYATESLYNVLAKLEDELRFVLITSGVTLTKVDSAPEGASATEVEGLWLSVNKASGQKCVRCWHHREDVGSHDGHEELCGRCVTNIDGDGEERHYA